MNNWKLRLAFFTVAMLLGIAGLAVDVILLRESHPLTVVLAGTMGFALRPIWEALT